MSPGGRDYEALSQARIQIGDKVIVQFDGGLNIDAVVISTPGGTGDLWQFRMDNGVVFTLNPYYHDFIGLIKIAPTRRLE